jgi:hypothetical protein
MPGGRPRKYTDEERKVRNAASYRAANERRKAGIPPRTAMTPEQKRAYHAAAALEAYHAKKAAQYEVKEAVAFIAPRLEAQHMAEQAGITV